MRGWFTLRLRRPPVSYRIGRRVPFVVAALLCVALAVMIVSVGIGEYRIAPLDVVRTLAGQQLDEGEMRLVVMELRLPRVLVGFAVGMALGMAGAVLQGVTRNPLAAPDVIGVTSGAGLAAVAVILFLPAVPAAALPLVAFGGAAVAALLIYLLAWRKGDSPLRMILVGIGLASMASALTTLLIAFGRVYYITSALIWLTGTVYARTWEHLWALLPWLGGFGGLAFLLIPQLNALGFGDDIARSLGMRASLQRGLLVLAAVGLSGAAVATAGTIGFVGLIAPHLSRRLVGPTYEGLLPTAALAGGVLVTLADLLGRSLFAPVEIPCGVITAIIGAPFFLFLLVRSRTRAAGGEQ